jgi:hypothetical protein
MLGSEDYSETRGSQMLQVQVSTAAMTVMWWRIGKQETLKFRSHVAVGAIQNSGFAKRFNSDLRTVCKLMRRGKNGDIALSEERPTVDPFWHIVEITNQGDIYLAL